MEELILAYPAPGCHYILDIDDSNVTVGAVLMQILKEREKTIAYWSRTWAKNQCIKKSKVKLLPRFQQHWWTRTTGS